MASQDDFSDLGAVPVDDFSDLGAIPISSSNTQQNNSSQGVPQDSSLFSDLVHIPYDLAVGAGSGIQNLAHDLLPSLVNKIEPQGIAQNIGEPIGEAASFMFGPEALIAKGASYASKYMPLIEKLTGEGASALSKRLASNTAFGAVTDPDDRLQGAATGLITGGIGETLGKVLGKGLTKSAEFLYPQKYATEVAGNINKGFRAAQKEATEKYNSVINKLGNQKIDYSHNYGHPSASYTRKSEYKKLDDKTFDEYSPALKKMHDKFMDESNVENAHYLQSDMGKEVSKLIRQNAPQEKIDKIKNGQELLQQDLNQYLKTKHPEEHKEYQAAGKFYKENVIPYTNEKVHEIATKNQETVTPEGLQKALREVTELKRGNNTEEYFVPRNHYLNQASKDLSHRINRGEAAGTSGSLASILAGTALGNILHPGITGTVLGGALGAGASAVGRRYIMPKALDLATNPTVHETLPKLKVPYDVLVKSLINAQSGSS